MYGFRGEEKTVVNECFSILLEFSNKRREILIIAYIRNDRKMLFRFLWTSVNFLIMEDWRFLFKFYAEFMRVIHDSIAVGVKFPNSGEIWFCGNELNTNIEILIG